MLVLFWINVKKSEEDSDELYKQLTFKRQVEKARQTYEELKTVIGKEEIDEIFNDYNFNDIVEALN